MQEEEPAESFSFRSKLPFRHSERYAQGVAQQADVFEGHRNRLAAFFGRTKCREQLSVVSLFGGSGLSPSADENRATTPSCGPAGPLFPLASARNKQESTVLRLSRRETTICGANKTTKRSAAVHPDLDRRRFRISLFPAKDRNITRQRFENFLRAESECL